MQWEEDPERNPAHRDFSIDVYPRFCRYMYDSFQAIAIANGHILIRST